MTLNTYSNYPKDSFLPGKQSQFADDGAHLSAKSQAKANSEKKSSNKIELSLAQLKEYARAQGFKLSKAYSKTFKNSSNWNIKNKTNNIERLTEKADKALEKLMKLSSSTAVLAGMEKMRAIFKGIDVTAIQNPFHKALAMVLNGAPGKEQALAYLAHCILSEGRFFSGNPRRSKRLVLRLLRRFASDNATLVKVRKKLHRARSEEKLHTVKQEIYWLSQGFGEGSSGPSYGQGDKQPGKASGPINAENTCATCKGPAISTAKHKQDEQPKLGEVQVKAKDPLVLAQEKPAPEIPAAPAVPGNVPPPPPFPNGIPLAPPPPPPKLPAQSKKVQNGAPGAAAQKAPIPPKTRSQRFKTVWNAYQGEITKPNDIIFFNDYTKKIEGGPKISPERMATVHPTIIAQLNSAQLMALNAYYFERLTDEQQQAIDPIVLKQLYAELFAKLKIFVIANDSKAQEIELKLACLKTTNVVHALSKVPPEHPSYHHIQVFIKDNCRPKERYINGGANTQKVEPILDQKRKEVLKALDYQPAPDEEVEQVTVVMLDHFYNKPVERPQAKAPAHNGRVSNFEVLVREKESLLDDRQRELMKRDPMARLKFTIALRATPAGKEALAKDKAEKEAEQEAARAQQSQENANANPFGGGNAGNRNANAANREGGTGNSTAPLSEAQQQAEAMKARREKKEEAARQEREAKEARAAEKAARKAREARNPGRPNAAQQGAQPNNANNGYGAQYNLDAEPVNPVGNPNAAPGQEVGQGGMNPAVNIAQPAVNVNNQASQAARPQAYQSVNPQAAPAGQGQGNNGVPPPPPLPMNLQAANNRTAGPAYGGGDFLASIQRGTVLRPVQDSAHGLGEIGAGNIATPQVGNASMLERVANLINQDDEANNPQPNKTDSDDDEWGDKDEDNSTSTIVDNATNSIDTVFSLAKFKANTIIGDSIRECLNTINKEIEDLNKIAQSNSNNLNTRKDAIDRILTNLLSGDAYLSLKRAAERAASEKASSVVENWVNSGKTQEDIQAKANMAAQEAAQKAVATYIQNVVRQKTDELVRSITHDREAAAANRPAAPENQGHTIEKGPMDIIIENAIKPIDTQFTENDVKNNQAIKDTIRNCLSAIESKTQQLFQLDKTSKNAKFDYSYNKKTIDATILTVFSGKQWLKSAQLAAKTAVLRAVEEAKRLARTEEEIQAEANAAAKVSAEEAIIKYIQDTVEQTTEELITPITKNINILSLSKSTGSYDEEDVDDWDD